MSLILVTGLSGSGKSLVINALEDIGYFCVDNIPSGLISKFVEFYKHGEGQLNKVAIVADIRGNSTSQEIQSLVQNFKSDANLDYKILYVDSSDSILQRRYKESRRRHPITHKMDITTEQALKMERDILSPVYAQADYILDTSLLSTAQLRDRVVSMFTCDGVRPMVLNILSFGFKFGLPKEADLVFDVRCVPNPYYVKELRDKTGLDKQVEDFVFEHIEAQLLLKHLKNLLEFSLPLYLKEGKSQLTVAVGCTGGKHRSVSFAKRLCAYCDTLGYAPQIHHRDTSRFN